MRRITDALCAAAGLHHLRGRDAARPRGAGLGVALLPPPALPRPGVVELTVTAPRAAREIGVAWLDGHRNRPRWPRSRVPAGAQGAVAAGLARSPGSYGPAAGRGFGAGVGHRYGDPVESVISHNPPFEDWVSVGLTVCQLSWCSTMCSVTCTVRVAGGVFAPGHLGELTRIVPFEMVDEVLSQTVGTERRLRELPSRVVVYLLLAAGVFRGAGVPAGVVAAGRGFG